MWPPWQGPLTPLTPLTFPAPLTPLAPLTQGPLTPLTPLKPYAPLTPLTPLAPLTPLTLEKARRLEPPTANPAGSGGDQRGEGGRRLEGRGVGDGGTAGAPPSETPLEVRAQSP